MHFTEFLRPQILLLGMLGCTFCNAPSAPSLADLAQARADADLARTRWDVCYQSGLTLPNVQLNGMAQLSGTDLLLTPDQAGQMGSAMLIPSIASTSELHVQLILQIKSTMTLGGDGIAFVLHRDPRGQTALAGSGSSIGYGPMTKITPSVVVEFDDFRNPPYDPDANHVGIMMNGDETTHLAAYTPPFTMSAGGQFYAWIDYVASTSPLSVYISATSTKPAGPQLAYNIDIANLFNNQPFFMGFTSGTGFYHAEHKLVSFIASSSPLDSAVCCSTNADCAVSAKGPVCDLVNHVCGM